MFSPIDIKVSIQKTDADQQELTELTRDLKRELGGVDGLSLSTDSESKSGISLLQDFMVKALSAGTITSLVQTIGTWLARDRTRTLKIQVGTNQIEASGLSRDEQKKLIEWFQIQAGMRFKN